MKKITKTQWKKMQTRYRILQEKANAASMDSQKCYGLNRIRREKAERAREKEFTFGSKMVDALAEVSPRDWSNGAPFYWICSKLTWEDIVRPLSEPLSVTPPVRNSYLRPMK